MSVATRDPSARLGDYLAALATAVPGPATLRRARAVVLDTVAAAQLADRTALAALAGHLPRQGPCATVLPSVPCTDPRTAALLNGTAAVWVELDEGYRGSGHPACHVVPAAVAVAEAEGASGDDLLAAIVTGYQLQADLGAAFPLDPAVHPHGRLGAPAAAAAAARVLGLDVEASRTAIDIAANLAPSGLWAAVIEGATVRNLLAGTGAAVGVEAAHLARAGVTAPRTSLETLFGEVRGRQPAAAAALPPSPATWAIDDGYLKRWPSCAYTHTALDVVDDLRRAHGLTIASIRSVAVEVPAVGMTMAGLHTASPLGRRFSLPFLVAALLALGELPVTLDAAAGRDDVRALARRVAVTEDPLMSAEWPRQMPARVTVTATGGRTWTGHRRDPEGPSDTDGHETAVRDKVRRRSPDAARAAALIARCDDLGPAAVRGLFRAHDPR